MVALPTQTTPSGITIITVIDMTTSPKDNQPAVLGQCQMKEMNDYKFNHLEFKS